MLPELNDPQLKQLAEFMSNLGLVFFGLVVAPLFSTANQVNPNLLIGGLFLIAGCVTISLVLLKNIHD